MSAGEWNVHMNLLFLIHLILDRWHTYNYALVKWPGLPDWGLTPSLIRAFLPNIHTLWDELISAACGGTVSAPADISTII